MTAIARGSRIRATARESPRCSRRSTLSRNSSVVASSQSRSTTPDSNRRCSGHPALANTAEHRPVVGEHLGGEPLDAVRSGDRREVLEHQRGDPLAVVLVGHHERGLRLVASRPAFVARPRDELAARFHDQCDAIDHVDAREVIEVACRQLRLRGEVPAVDAVGRLRSVEGGEGVTVAGGHRPDDRRVAVAEDDRRLPRRGIRGRRHAPSIASGSSGAVPGRRVVWWQRRSTSSPAPNSTST